MKKGFRRFLYLIMAIIIQVVVRDLVKDIYANLVPKSASEVAISCLKENAYSYEALYRQLISAGFSEEEVKKTMGQLNIDWKEQAVRSADAPPDRGLKDLTKDELIERLLKEGFTEEEAGYAAGKQRFFTVVDGKLVYPG